MSGTRPYVDAFADEMEAKLAENRHKGDRDGWASMDVRWLLEQLRKEVDELDAALPVALGVRGADDFRFGYGMSPLTIRRECADVANFAMMIADVAGGMRAKAALKETT